MGRDKKYKPYGLGDEDYDSARLTIQLAMTITPRRKFTPIFPPLPKMSPFFTTQRLWADVGEIIQKFICQLNFQTIHSTTTGSRLIRPLRSVFLKPQIGLSRDLDDLEFLLLPCFSLRSTPLLLLTVPCFRLPMPTSFSPRLERP
jgi:hypothetical protein